jgi:hypothetical protein
VNAAHLPQSQLRRRVKAVDIGRSTQEQIVEGMVSSRLFSENYAWIRTPRNYVCVSKVNHRVPWPWPATRIIACHKKRESGAVNLHIVNTAAKDLEVSDNIILQDYYTPHVEGRSPFVKARQTNVVNLCCDSRLQNRQMATNVDIPVSVSERVTGLTEVMRIPICYMPGGCEKVEFSTARNTELSNTDKAPHTKLHIAIRLKATSVSCDRVNGAPAVNVARTC